jgi:hypothetical protein
MAQTAVMPRAQPAVSGEATSALPSRRRFTIHEYQRMADVGVLGHREPVELLDGEIVEMSPIGNRQMAVVDRLNMLLARRLGDKAIVRV